MVDCLGNLLVDRWAVEKEMLTTLSSAFSTETKTATQRAVEKAGLLVELRVAVQLADRKVSSRDSLKGFEKVDLREVCLEGDSVGG